jgi:hypothetical protein
MECKSFTSSIISTLYFTKKIYCHLI